MNTPRSIGIDISGWQGNTDFEKVRAAGADFCFVKGTDGASGTINRHFDSQLRGSLAAGLITGVYHYCQFESAAGVSIERDARIEARRLLDECGALADGLLPPVLDVEDRTGHTRSGAELLEWIAAFVDECEGSGIRNGCTPILYTGPGFWMQYAALGAARELARCPLWTAEYRRKVDPQADNPRLYAPWEHWTIWQYAGDPKANGLAHWPGVNGYCDRNVWNGDVRFVRGMAQHPDPPTVRA